MSTVPPLPPVTQVPLPLAMPSSVIGGPAEAALAAFGSPAGQLTTAPPVPTAATVVPSVAMPRKVW